MLLFVSNECLHRAKNKTNIIGVRVTPHRVQLFWMNNFTNTVQYREREFNVHCS